MNGAMQGDPCGKKAKPDQLGTEAKLDYHSTETPLGRCFQSEADVSSAGLVFTMRSDPSLESWFEIYFHW